MVRLNHYGWSVAAIAKYKDKSAHTVRASLHRWQNQGLKGLWEGGNRGRKRQWLEEDLQHLETCLEQEQRTYNATQLAQKLAEERGVKLSADRLRKLLKKADATQPSSYGGWNAHQAGVALEKNQTLTAPSARSKTQGS